MFTTIRQAIQARFRALTSASRVGGPCCNPSKCARVRAWVAHDSGSVRRKRLASYDIAVRIVSMSSRAAVRAFPGVADLATVVIAIAVTVIAMIVSVPTMIVVDIAARAFPSAGEVLPTGMVRCNPIGTGIRWSRPIAVVPLVVRSLRILITLDPHIIGTGLCRHAVDLGWRRRTDVNIDADLRVGRRGRTDEKCRDSQYVKSSSHEGPPVQLAGQSIGRSRVTREIRTRPALNCPALGCPRQTPRSWL